MEFHTLSIFPQMFDQVFAHSIPRIAQEKGTLKIKHHDLRQWSTDKHHKVDDTPYGGGPGMVIKCDVIYAAVEEIAGQCEEESKDSGDAALRKIILTPGGRKLDQQLLNELAQEDKILLICGRYEGFDERVYEGLELERVSIGDYVLSGGEIAAMVILDGVTRLLPGVLGDAESARLESFQEDDLLDYPVYTRPAVFRDRAVPEVLLSGHHEQIMQWRKEQALLQTKQRRQDLLQDSRPIA